MTIEEAIERYSHNAEYERANGNLQGCLEFKQLVDWLKDYKRLKEQEPKTEWIPVSERLPKDGQFVLFCDIDDDIMVGYHVKGRPTTHFSQDGTYDDVKNVVAWMPLQEPYKESEGNNGD